MISRNLYGDVFENATIKSVTERKRTALKAAWDRLPSRARTTDGDSFFEISYALDARHKVIRTTIATDSRGQKRETREQFSDKELDDTLAQLEIDLQNASKRDRILHEQALTALNRLSERPEPGAHFSTKATVLAEIFRKRFDKYRRTSRIHNEKCFNTLETLIETAFGRDSKLCLSDKHLVAKSIIQTFKYAKVIEGITILTPTAEALRHYLVARTTSPMGNNSLDRKDAEEIGNLLSSIPNEKNERSNVLVAAYREICNSRDKYDDETLRSTGKSIWNVLPAIQSRYSEKEYAFLLTSMIRNSSPSGKQALLHELAASSHTSPTYSRGPIPMNPSNNRSTPSLFDILQRMPESNSLVTGYGGRGDLLAELNEAIFPKNGARQSRSRENEASFNEIVSMTFDQRLNLSIEQIGRIVTHLGKTFETDFAFDSNNRPIELLRTTIKQSGPAGRTKLLLNALKHPLAPPSPPVVKPPIPARKNKLSSRAQVESLPYFFPALSDSDAKILLMANKGKFIVRTRPQDVDSYFVTYVLHDEDVQNSIVIAGDTLKDRQFRSLSEVLKDLEDKKYKTLKRQHPKSY